MFHGDIHDIEDRSESWSWHMHTYAYTQSGARVEEILVHDIPDMEATRISSLFITSPAPLSWLSEVCNLLFSLFSSFSLFSRLIFSLYAHLIVQLLDSPESKMSCDLSANQFRTSRDSQARSTFVMMQDRLITRGFTWDAWPSSINSNFLREIYFYSFDEDCYKYLTILKNVLNSIILKNKPILKWKIP